MVTQTAESKPGRALELPVEPRLTTEQQRVKELGLELARDFATRAAEHDRERTLPTENFAKLREAGLFGAVIPKELGGLGVGMVGWVGLAEELAQGCASMTLAFNMHINATGGISHRSALPLATRRRIAALALDSGALMGTSASEPAVSSLLPGSFRFSTEARKVHGGYQLYGRKMFVSMFEASDYCYLYAHPEGHPNRMRAIALLVPTNQPGIRVTDIWDTHGMRATRSNQVDYDGAFVPDDLVLYETESFIDSFIIEEAAWAFGGFCATYMGLGLGILDAARKLLASRKAKGYAQEMGYHPNISSRYGEMVTDMDAARLMVYRAAWEYDTRGGALETFHWFMKAKLAVGNAVQRVVNNAMVSCGAHALLALHLRETTPSEGSSLDIHEFATSPAVA